ncbi:cell wall protein RBR3-like [Nilaparvata lugens]|uniref:cell wall protein RBR3-like n=1 Tax=Nilaparvata lugens TaxID=108931 RepID=UPI00193E3DAF|nr:cell wall protein RBR3-like [Nilaparvata lugens]
MGDFSLSKRPKSAKPSFTSVPKTWANTPALSWACPIQATTSWPPPTTTSVPTAVMPLPSSTITSGALMSASSSTITSGALMSAPSSTITSGALMSAPSSTITSGALMSAPSSTITSGAFMEPPTWTTTTEPSSSSPTKAVTSGFSTIELGSPQKTNPIMQVNPTTPATSSWTPTPGPSREPNTHEKPYISKPTSWHFRPVDETRAREHDKIFQEEEMNQAFSRSNQGLSIREGGGQSIRERGRQSIRREIIDVSKIGHLRKTNDPTKIKGWRRKFGTGITFSPSNRTNTPNPSEPQKKITESPESPQKKTPIMQLEEPAEDSRRESNLSELEEDLPLDESVDFMLDEEDVETPVEWTLPPPEERELEVPEAGTSRQQHIELRRNEEMFERILMNALNNLQFDSMTIHGDMLEIRSSNELATVDPASDNNWKYTDKVLVEASPNAVRINVAADDVRENVIIIGEDFMTQPWCGITLNLCDPIESGGPKERSRRAASGTACSDQMQLKMRSILLPPPHHHGPPPRAVTSTLLPPPHHHGLPPQGRHVSQTLKHFLDQIRV